MNDCWITCGQELFQLELDSNANILKQGMLHEENAHPIRQGIHFIVRDITADFNRKLAFNSRQLISLVDELHRMNRSCIQIKLNKIYQITKEKI